MRTHWHFPLRDCHGSYCERDVAGMLAQPLAAQHSQISSIFPGRGKTTGRQKETGDREINRTEEKICKEEREEEKRKK